MSASKAGAHLKHPPQAPVSLDHLFALCHSIDISKSFDTAVWACTLVTFFSCRRLGETTVKSSSSYSPSHNITAIPDCIIYCSAGGRVASASFHIPWTKTTREVGADIIITAQQDELCPVAALLNHTWVNCNPLANVSLFTYRTQDGNWVNMFKHSFMDFVQRIWDRANLTHVSGHSFCIGGTVALLLAGVSPEVISFLTLPCMV